MERIVSAINNSMEVNKRIIENKVAKEKRGHANNTHLSL